MAASLEHTPMTVNPAEVMRDEQKWTSIARPDETPIPYAAFTTHESADSFDSAFDYRTPSFQHLSDVLNCSGFQLTEQEQSYLLSAISATKPAPAQTKARRPSSSSSSSSNGGIRSGRVQKPQRSGSKASCLREPATPQDEDVPNPFSSLAPIQHSLGPKDVPRFYGMRITAQEIDMLEDLLGTGDRALSSPTDEELASPVPSLGWSEAGDDLPALSPGTISDEPETVSPFDVFARPEGFSDRDQGSSTIRGIFIPSDEGEDEDDGGEWGGQMEVKEKPQAGKVQDVSREDGLRRVSVVPMEDEEKESYKATLAPIRAYSWKGRLSSGRRSSVGI